MRNVWKRTIYDTKLDGISKQWWCDLRNFCVGYPMGRISMPLAQTPAADVRLLRCLTTGADNCITIHRDEQRRSLAPLVGYPIQCHSFDDGLTLKSIYQSLGRVNRRGPRTTDKMRIQRTLARVVLSVQSICVRCHPSPLRCCSVHPHPGCLDD